MQAPRSRRNAVNNRSENDDSSTTCASSLNVWPSMTNGISALPMVLWTPGATVEYCVIGVVSTSMLLRRHISAEAKASLAPLSTMAGVGLLLTATRILVAPEYPLGQPRFSARPPNTERKATVFGPGPPKKGYQGCRTVPALQVGPRAQQSEFASPSPFWRGDLASVS